MTDPCEIKLDHGVIGNGSVLALVAPTTHIDWLCMPRFDSASVFARILDVENGGTFVLQPDSSRVQTRMDYVLNTNVLRTEVTCDEGRFDVYDYAPRIPAGLGVEAPVEIQRLIIPREGAARVRVLFDPKPDYARCQQPQIVPISGGLQIGDGSSALYLRTNAPVPYLESGQPIRVDEPLYLRAELRQSVGDRLGRIGEARSRSDDRGLARVGQVVRAAIVRKPAGASLGALPEAARVYGNGRDHRRGDDEHSGGHRLGADLGLPLLLACGMRRLSSRRCDGSDISPKARPSSRFCAMSPRAGPLQPLYGIGGERELVEEHLDHLEGYCGSQAGAHRQRRVPAEAARPDGRDDPLPRYADGAIRAS